LCAFLSAALNFSAIRHSVAGTNGCEASVISQASLRTVQPFWPLNGKPISSQLKYKVQVLLVLSGQVVVFARAGKRTRDLSFSFIFSFHHFTAEPQRLPSGQVVTL
jgi:hypothetical protein